MRARAGREGCWQKLLSPKDRAARESPLVARLLNVGTQRRLIGRGCSVSVPIPNQMGVVAAATAVVVSPLAAPPFTYLPQLFPDIMTSWDNDNRIGASDSST